MTDKMRIKIDLVLPSVSDIRDACVQRLTELLTAKEGIETTYAADNKGVSQDQICIHYDPERLSWGRCASWPNGQEPGSISGTATCCSN